MQAKLTPGMDPIILTANSVHILVQEVERMVGHPVPGLRDERGYANIRFWGARRCVLSEMSASFYGVSLKRGEAAPHIVTVPLDVP